MWPFPIFVFDDSAQAPEWEYSKEESVQNILLMSSFWKPSEEKTIYLEPKLIDKGYYLEDQYKLSGSAIPYLPSSIKNLLEKSKKGYLKDNEVLKLMEEIAEISTKFYNLKEGKYVALGLDGRIVETADSSIDLLSKIQGKHYSIPIFIWHIGSDVFSGWNI